MQYFWAHFCLFVFANNFISSKMHKEMVDIRITWGLPFKNFKIEDIV